MKESTFQQSIINELRERLPDCVILKNDANQKQGFPDLLILYNDRWAALEVKRSNTASHRPNQDYYVDKLDGMSFASFISPETKEEILNELQRSLSA